MAASIWRRAAPAEGRADEGEVESMRRIALGFALGVLLASAPGGAALAAQPDASVLTPGQLGLTEPAQGFYPYFVGAGNTPGQQPAVGFFGTGGIQGLGVTSAFTSAIPGPGQPGYWGFSGFPPFGGSPFALGAASYYGTGCGVFSLSYCPLFTSQAVTTGLTGGIGGFPVGAAGFPGVGFPGVGGFGVGFPGVGAGGVFVVQ
jgi:hypothetical protein